jgi:hypothetical protein
VEAKKRHGLRDRVIAAAVILVFVAVVIVATRPGWWSSDERGSGAAIGANLWSEELPNTRVLLLFYPEAGSGRLKPEPKRFAVMSGTPGLMKSALNELGRDPGIEGLVSPFKHEISVRGVYSQEDGTLYVDLGAGAEDIFGTGLSEEIAAVGAITNTLFYNFPHVSRLRILVDGDPVSSIEGHVDLSGFLYPELWLRSSEVEL